MRAPVAAWRRMGKRRSKEMTTRVVARCGGDADVSQVGNF
jgi:hypothetical protein